MQLLELEHGQDPWVNFPVLIRSYILDPISCLSLQYICCIFLENYEFFFLVSFKENGSFSGWT